MIKMKYWLLVLFVLCGGLAGAQAPHSTLPKADFVTLRKGLPHFAYSVYNQHKATVAFVGGSITFNPGWRDELCAWLKQQYADVQFTFVTAAIPSLGSVAHVFRLKQDLLEKANPDLVFVETAVNDRGNGTDSITQVRALDGIVRQIKLKNRRTDVVLMAFADPDKTGDYNKGVVPVEIANHEVVAAHYQSPSINLGKEVRDRIANNELNWDRDFKDIHPAEYGQHLYFTTIQYLLQQCLATAPSTKERAAAKLPAAMNKATFQKGHYYALSNARTDSGWVYHKNWAPQDGLSTREGYVHVPVLASEKPGAQMHLPFTGTAVGIAVIAGADAGTISYAIDNAAFRDLDLYTVHSSWLHLPCYWLLAGDLKKGKHTLHIRISQQSNKNSKGHACRIARFLVNG